MLHLTKALWTRVDSEMHGFSAEFRNLFRDYLSTGFLNLQTFSNKHTHNKQQRDDEKKDNEQRNRWAM